MDAKQLAKEFEYQFSYEDVDSRPLTAAVVYLGKALLMIADLQARVAQLESETNEAQS